MGKLFGLLLIQIFLFYKFIIIGGGFDVLEGFGYKCHGTLYLHVRCLFLYNDLGALHHICGTYF